MVEHLFKEKLPKITEDTIQFVFEQSPKYLARYLRPHRRIWEDALTKHEILAYYKQGNYSLEEIGASLLRPASRGGRYDYFSEAKEELEKQIKNKLAPEIFEKNKEEIEKTFKLVFVDEYEDEIAKALAAIKLLEKLGKSKKEIIPLLMPEPLSSWWKLVVRTR